jgi:small subunit ribosomal protein S16
MGKKRQPVYKVVAADVRSPRDGKFIEAIGLYNPKTDPATVEIDEARAMYWLSVGALPTATVKNLLQQEGILYKMELEKKGLSEDEVSVKLAEWNQLHEAKSAKVQNTKLEKQKAEEKAAEEKAKAEEKAELEKAETEKAESESQKIESEESPTEVKGAASDETQTEEDNSAKE